METQLPATAREAREAGVRMYWTGKPCKYGHMAPRITRGHRCVECEKHSARKQRHSNPENISQSCARWASKNKEQRRRIWRANSRVYAAVQRGILVKPEACWACGSKGPIHAHHADYDNPLGVTWLCVDCHHQIHRQHR